MTTKPTSTGPFDFQSGTKPSALPRPLKKQGPGYGIAAIVLGVVAVCITFGGLAFWPIAFAALPCAILAIIFGNAGRNSESAGMAQGGVVLGWITVIAPFVVGGIALMFVQIEISNQRERQRREAERFRREDEKLQREEVEREIQWLKKLSNPILK
jgi:hypothetical protein